MFRSKLILSTALSALCFTASQTVLTPVASAKSAHVKMIKLSIANSGTETLNLMIGTQAMTVEPGKTVAVTGVEGANITVVNDTQHHKAGELLTQVTNAIAGATLRVS